MAEIGSIVIIGIALASLWYWLSVLLRVTHPDKGIWIWVKIIVPQGIVIALAARILYGFFT